MMRVLVVGVTEGARATLSNVLARHGFEVVVTTEVDDARDELRRRDFDLVLSGVPDVSDLVRLAGPAAVGLVADEPLRGDELRARRIAFNLTMPLRADHVLAQVSSVLNLPPVTEAQRATIAAYFACLERGDWASLAALCTPEVLYHLPSGDAQLGRTIMGRESLRELAAETFGEFKEAQFEIESIRALPRGMSVRYRGSWLAADASRPSVPGAVLLVFSGDQISEIGVRIDVDAIHHAA